MNETLTTHNDKKAASVAVRLTTDERQALDAIASAKKISISELIRRAVLKGITR